MGLSLPGLPASREYSNILEVSRMPKVFALLLSLGFLVNQASAQLASTTSLVGNVNDQAGAVMSGVRVTAINDATAESYTAVTNKDGYYSFQFVKVGTYTITASQSGFQMLTKQGIRVETNQTVRTDFTMSIGQVNEKVVVTAQPPPISTDDATLSEIISAK